jgi:type IV secretion system protein TrbJ
MSLMRSSYDQQQPAPLLPAVACASRSLRSERVERRRGWVAGGLRHAIVAIGIVLPIVAAPASAQVTVYDPANYAENVLHYVSQLTQIKNQVQQLKYQLRALSKLPSAPWRDVERPLRVIEGTMGRARSLGYAASGVGATFQGYFPVARKVADWPTEQRAQSQAEIDVFGAAVEATAQQQATVAPGAATVQRMKELNGAVDGHEQALELQNTAAVYAAEELMLLRQAAMAQTNIQAVFYANQVNAQAQRDGTVRATLAQLSAMPSPPTNVSLRVTP